MGSDVIDGEVTDGGGEREKERGRGREFMWEKRERIGTA
jgi:hypothetical protein